MKKIILIWLISLVIGVFSVSANANSDSLKLKVRTFDQEALNKYRASSDFNYSDANSKNQNEFEQMLYWLLYKILQFFSHKFVFYPLLVIIAVFLIYLIAKSTITPVFTRNESGDSGQWNDMIDQLETTPDFLRLIADAETAGDFKKATRFLFLYLLYRLQQNGQIAISRQKTNFDYAYEITDNEQRKWFRKLAGIFEYVQYGDFIPDQSQFLQIHSEFKRFPDSSKSN